MSNERAGKPGEWKERLDNLDTLPGEPWAGKSASWDRLHTRLHEKKRRKKLPWWWLAAAAVLLLFVGGALLMAKHTGNGLAKNKPLPVHRAPYLPAPATPVHPAAPESLLVINNNPVSATVARATVSRPRRQPKTTLPPAGIPADTQATLQARITPPPADTPLLTRIAAQPKKKLQVVHINELDGRGQDDRQWTNSPSYSPKRFFRLLLINTETSSSAAAEKPGAANNRFTIKTPIKN